MEKSIVLTERLKENYERLAQEIIVQAARDYRDALRILKKDPENFLAGLEARQIEAFFRGRFYEILTKVPGELLIQKLREEIGI